VEHGQFERSRADAHGMRRARLLDLLRRPARLAVVLAPAGSGKTTLLAQYAEAVGASAVWYRASRAGADSAALPELIGTLGPGPVTLIVDDAQLLIGGAAEAALDRLLADGPPGLSVVLASRRAPRLNLCRAELGEVTVVDADDLRFRSWEVETLFRDHYRAPLPPDDVAALTRHTEGWAACLRLFHLSTRSRSLPERRRAVLALTGGPRFARTYLAHAILQEVPGDLRVFLSRTAVFEVLTGERCDRLLGTRDGQARLEQLARLEALTTTDDGGRTFRYHEVLRRHLESALLDELGPARTSAWYERAALLLEEQGAPGEALRTYLRAERWDQVARLLRDDGPRAITAETGHHWHDLLPPAMIDEDPWLSTAVARRLAAEGRLDAAARRYRHAEGLFPDSADRERAARERRLVELWTTGRPQPHLHWLDRLRAALDRPGTPHPRDPAAPGDLLCDAVSTLLTGNVTAAAPVIGSLLERLDPDGPTLLAARLVHALVDALLGADTSLVADRLAADAERAGATWIARQARALHAFLARDLDQLDRVARQCTGVGDTWGELLCRAAEALRLLLDGRQALPAWQALAERTRGIGAGALDAWVAAMAAVAGAAEGARGAAGAATAAEGFGRARGVWGTQALTALALAAARGSDPGTARALADGHGLPWSGALERRVLGRPGPVGPAAPAAVRIRCFGGFELEVAGRTLDWHAVRPRAACALRLLAARTPHPVHREVLLALWPGLSPDQATHSLQVAVSSLRSLLAPDAPRGSFRLIQRTGQAYALVLPPGSSADVLDLDTALGEAERARRDGRTQDEADALERAVATYGGELLPEDGPAEWVVADRERWRLRAAAACTRLTELRLAAGDLQATIDAARRGVAIDPFSDGMWRALIAASARTGDAAAAARARRDYAAVLRELGLGPAARPRVAR
jgi:DNA-binding SARP family transcriptional activator